MFRHLCNRWRSPDLELHLRSSPGNTINIQARYWLVYTVETFKFEQNNSRREIQAVHFKRQMVLANLVAKFEWHQTYWLNNLVDIEIKVHLELWHIIVIRPTRKS